MTEFVAFLKPNTVTDVMDTMIGRSQVREQRLDLRISNRHSAGYVF